MKGLNAMSCQIMTFINDRSTNEQLEYMRNSIIPRTDIAWINIISEKGNIIKQEWFYLNDKGKVDYKGFAFAFSPKEQKELSAIGKRIVELSKNEPLFKLCLRGY